MYPVKLSVCMNLMVGDTAYIRSCAQIKCPSADVYDSSDMHPVFTCCVILCCVV